MTGFVRLSREEKQQTKGATSIIKTSHYTWPEYTASNISEFEQYNKRYVEESYLIGFILPQSYWSQSTKQLFL